MLSRQPRKSQCTSAPTVTLQALDKLTIRTPLDPKLWSTAEFADAVLCAKNPPKKLQLAKSATKFSSTKNLLKK